MLDIRFIRENPEQVQENAERKGYKDISVVTLLKLDDARRALQQRADELREKRNLNAAKMKGGKPEQSQIDEGKQIKAELAEIEPQLMAAEQEFGALLKKIPNMALADVPFGASEDENVIAKTIGSPTEFDFTPKNHAQIAEAKGWLDKERAAKVAG